MKVKELIEFCQNIPDEAEVEALMCDDAIIDGCGRGIDRLEYHRTSEDADGTVFIRLE